MWTFPSIPAGIMGQNVPGKLEPLRRVLVPEWIQDFFLGGGGASLRNGFKFVAFIFLLFFFLGRVPLTLESHRSSLGVGGGSSQSVTYPQLFSSHAFLPIEYCAPQMLL